MSATPVNSDDAQREEALKKLRRMAISIRSQLDEMYALFGAVLNEEQDQRLRPPKKTDKNGEPTWHYVVKVKIPDNMYLTRQLRGYAIKEGVPGDRVDGMFDDFRRYYLKSGKKWMAWSLVWCDWVRREVGHGKGADKYVSRYDRS